MKVVERIFEHRIRQQIGIDDTQFGLMKGKGTIDGFFGQPFVKRFILCYQTTVCLVCLSIPSCLSVTLGYCGQMVRWIKMKLASRPQQGLPRLGHIMLDAPRCLF